jgi:hypothetical protein
MPSLRDSLIEFDPKRYGRVPIQQPIFNPAMPPELPNRDPPKPGDD